MADTPWRELGTCKTFFTPPPIKKNLVSFGVVELLIDIALSIYERYAEVKLLMEYWECGHMNWFWLTVACILLPVVIMTVHYTIVAIRHKEFFLNTAFSLVFPISSVIA